jgi:TolB-like protein/DNA-binding winged helix-turn-helix (wHTH) protein/Tfp pilus assembly protein PilF
VSASPLKADELLLDLKRYQLRRNGSVLRIEKIPMELLILLVEKKGDLVSREEIIERLWGKDIFLDTEQGINTAIRKIRLALKDDSEQSRFVQTVVGKGYRFIGPITVVKNGSASAETSDEPHLAAVTASPNATAPPRRSHLKSALAAVVVTALAVLLAFGFNFLGVRQRLLTRNLQIRSIAVLPLENLSGDATEDYFAEGMTDELITNLAKVSSLRVISRTSVMRFKGARRPLSEIARALNVDAVVEGSVVRSGNRVRVTAQLIYAPTDRHLWAEEYERDQRDVLELQSEVARTIVQGIRATLTPQEQLRLVSRGAVKPEAYEVYLRGRSYWNQRTEAALGKAIDQFSKAIQDDANFAEAYSGLADSYTTLGYLSYLDPNDAFPRAKTAATKALELDPTLAEAHASLAYYNLYYAWNWVEAEREFRQAISLNSNYATAHEWYSIFLLATRRPEEAWAEINRARELDPLSVSIMTDVGFNYFYRQEYDQAISQLRRTLAINPKFPLAHLWLGRAYQQKHMYGEAIGEFDQVNSVLPDWIVTIAGTGNAYGEWGERAKAVAILARLNQLSRQKYVTPYGIALVYAGLDDKQEAFAWLDKAVEGRSHWLVWLNLDPRWERLRADSRFAEVRERVGLP